MPTPDQQLDHLIGLGLVISDREQAVHSLRHIGYHRLSSYWQPFQIHSNGDRDCAFRNGVGFSEVLEHYRFDGYLRSTLTEALGQIEVSARALWASHLADAGGDKAHLDPRLFTGREYRKNLPELEQTTKEMPSAAAQTIVAYLMDVIDPGDYWKTGLVDLMTSYPRVSKDRMGFPNNWEDMVFWR